MEAAVVGSPRSKLQLSQIDTDSALARAETGAGVPVLTWQSEGIGSGFSREANAVDYLRLSLPFNRPWQLDTVRDLRNQAEVLRQSGQRSSRLEVAVLAGQAWLDLAAAKEHEQLARTRLDRLDRALAIQQKRYELGEISGSERTQVELQQAQDAVAFQTATAQRFALHRKLEILVPIGLTAPSEQDLGRLVEATTSPGEAELEGLLSDSPLLELSGARAQISRLTAERQKSTVWGQPEVEIEWEKIPSYEGVDSYDAFGFRLAYPLPLGKQGRQRRAAAESQAEAATAQHDLLYQEVRSRLLAAVTTAKGAEAALEALAPSLKGIEATERSLTEQFRLGAISYLVYLDGFARLDEVVQQTIAVRHQLLAARLEIALLSGSDLYFPIPELPSEDPS